MILGTAPYMSPEQVRGQDVDRLTDVCAFGCVLYEMLTGERAFAGATATDVLAKVLEGFQAIGGRGDRGFLAARCEWT